MTPHQQDWHRAYIRAALEVKGLTLRDLSRNAGLAEDTLKNALFRPWPKGERIIADAIGVEPEEIWPSRYGQKGTHQHQDVA